MDGALSSSRHDNNNYNNHQSNYHQRRDYRRGGGGGHGRGGGGGYHRRGGRGGYHHDRRHQPYRRGGRGNGGGYGGGGRGGHRNPGNRFDNNTSTKSVDPQEAMLKQLTAMVAKMGDLIECAKCPNVDAAAAAAGTDTITGEGMDTTNEFDVETTTRGVVKAVSRNIQDLVMVLCSVGNAPMFLKFDDSSTTTTTTATASSATNTNETNAEDGMKKEDMNETVNENESSALLPTTTTATTTEPTKINAVEEAGPLATLVTSCAATLPLQSPSYVGLTLGVEEYAPEIMDGAQVKSYKGFARRCVTMATRRICADLDKTCGVTFLLDSTTTTTTTTTTSSQSAIVTKTDESNSRDSFVDAFMRCKLLLRYFALLAKAGIILDYDETKDSIDIEEESISSSSSSSYTLAGVLKLLTIAAMKAYEASSKMENNTKAACESFKNTSILLSGLVLFTIPYVSQLLPREFLDFIMMKIGDVLESYQSNYQPGDGILAILLKKEIHEEAIDGGDGDDEEEEDDDDDDDDDDEAAPPCADNLQDLLRTVRKVIDSNSPTRFALLTDSPWSILKGKEQEYAPMEGDDEDAMLKQQQKTSKLEYTGEKILLSFDGCVLISYLFSLNNNEMNDDSMNGTSLATTIALQCQNLDGVVFGRLSIFDPPPDDEDDEDEEDDDQPENPDVGAYVKTFSLLDRYFLSESVRDCLVCHKSSISSSGLEKGSCKDVAEQIWGVCHLFKLSDADTNNDSMKEGENDESNKPILPKGVEYGIVETILSLIVQSPKEMDSNSPLSHIYLSRVLIELTKFQPALVPQSLVVAVGAMFNDFLPSMSPLAKANLSQWLAFHLTNTDYQWPQAYWDVWTPFVVKGMGASATEVVKRNCRGEFVTSALQYMASNLSSPEPLLNNCLPVQSELSKFILCKSRTVYRTESNALEGLQRDLNDRIWYQNEDPEKIRDFVIGDEISESVQNDFDESGGSSNQDAMWWRTGLIIRALLQPASKDKRKVEHVLNGTSSDDMMEDIDPKEDVLTDFGDILQRYKPVILATFAQDIKVHEENLDLRGETKKTESDMMLAGETFILNQCENVTCFSNPILESCVDMFLQTEIVSPKAVVNWSIGGGSDNSTPNPIVSGWWNYATSAARKGLDKSMSTDRSNVESLSGDIGMIIDTGGDEEDAKSATPSIRRMTKATEYMKPLLRFTTNRVSKFLEETNNDGNATGKETNAGADLKEGLKHFTRSMSSYLRVTLKEDPIVQSTTELGGPSLEVETFLANLGM